MEYQEFSNKNDLFNYLDSGIDKSGNLKKEGGFRKHYPTVFVEAFLPRRTLIDYINMNNYIYIWHSTINLNKSVSLKREKPQIGVTYF